MSDVTNSASEETGSESAEAFSCSASLGQQNLWFLDQLQPGQATYNIPVVLDLTGAVDWLILQRCIDSLVDRHEVLRAHFAVLDEQLSMVVPDTVAVPIARHDLSAHATPSEEAERLTQEEVARPFRLATGPLVRVMGVTLGPDRHRLVIVVHHIVSDAWSQAILIGELAALYRAYLAGQPSPLLPLEIQYPDYCAWLEERLTPALVERQLDNLEQTLGDAPEPPGLPADRARPPVASSSGDRRAFTIDPETSERLRQFCRAEGITTFMALVAALDILVSRYTGADDITIGSPVAGRPRPELEQTVGYFVNTIALRTSLAGEPSFRETAGRVREAALGAFQHQDVPFVRVAEAVRRVRASPSPLFSIMCVAFRAPEGSLDLGPLSVRFVPVHTRTSKFDWLWEFHETSTIIKGYLEFSRDLFPAAAADRAIASFKVLLAAALESPDDRFTLLPLLSTDDIATISAINMTTVPYERASTISEVFEARVDAAPDHVAAVCGDHERTRDELNRRANRLAGLLRNRGVGPGTCVGVAQDRSLDLLVSLLAILKAGAAYVPLDLTYPRDRIRFMLDDSGAALVLTLTDQLAALDTSVPVIALDDPSLDLASFPDGNLPQTATAQSPAYAMYTSGSTGVPKGVIVPHRGVLRLVRGTTFVPWTEVTAILHLASVSFDASTFEVWGALLNDARSVIVPDRMVEFDAVEQAIHRGRVDCVWLTAALFNTVIDTRPDLLAGVKWVLAGGEALSAHHVRRAQAHLPGTQLINGYGPTETTTFACCYPIPPALEAATVSIPIGRPIANTTVHVLDAAKQPVPVGVTGELFIGGDGVAAGYVNQPELSAERFLPDPFSGTPGARLYRTGDLVRLRDDGNLMFLGRVDRQVKIRGFRIEPGEIEAVLGRHPAVRQCVVVAPEDSAGGRRLVAYVEADAGAVSDALYRAHMEAALPSYMIPASLVVLPAFPLTTNGKIDHSRLPVEGAAAATPKDAARAPVTATEQMIATAWKSVLGLSEVSVTDNFFEVGGHSLAALRVFSAIEKQLGVMLPLATLFTTPTLGALAAEVDRARVPHTKRKWPALVTITEADGPPLVCVHSLSGDILEYRDLARWLGPSQHVIGVQATLDADLEAVYGTVESTASTYLAELKKVQPEGPYYLCGWSSGGIIVLEMAQQLLAAGQEVALLAIIDTAPWVTFDVRRPFLQRWLMQIANIPRWLRDDVLVAPKGDLTLRVKQRLGVIGRRLKNPASRTLDVRDVVSFPERTGVWERFVQLHFRAMQKYRAGTYPGRVSIFRAPTHPLLRLNEPHRIWQRMAAEVDVYLASGTHFSIVKEPHVKVLAEAVADAVAKARSNAGGRGQGAGAT